MDATRLIVVQSRFTHLLNSGIADRETGLNTTLVLSSKNIINIISQREENTAYPQVYKIEPFRYAPLELTRDAGRLLW
jgi:hypothetical protein